MVDDGSEEGRLMLAEIWRELGEFDAAIRQIDGLTSPDLAGFAAKIRRLCEARNTDVQLIEDGRRP